MRVFICHSTDRESMAILGRLRQFKPPKVDFWIAEELPRPGTRISEKVISALQECDAVLLILTSRAAQSPWVNQELALAYANEKPVVPLKTKDAEVRGIIEGLECVEIDPANPAWAFQQVASILEQIRRGGKEWKTTLHAASLKRKRPLGVEVLSGLLGVGGGGGLVVYGLVLVLMLTENTVNLSDSANQLLMIQLGVVLLFCAGLLASAVGLYRMRRWAYITSLAFLVFALLFSLWMYSTQPWQTLFLYLTGFFIISLVYLVAVRSRFRSRAMAWGA